MATKFIKINDISEIDTSRVTVQDLKNRYIDGKGNLYGLKYNRNNRKVEIIKIIRTPVKSADYYRQIMRKSKKNGSAAQNDKSYFDIDQTIQDNESRKSDGSTGEPDTNFNPEKFIEDTIELVRTHAERLEGIMKNIKASRVIPDGDRVNSAQLVDIFRNLDIDGIQRIEKILANYKEIREYPRSISYYIAKQNTRSKDIIDKLGSDTQKMKYVLHAEMYFSVTSLYRTLYKILKDLFFFLENTNADEMKDLTFAEKQDFHDAKLSIDNTLSECEKVMKDIKNLDAYLYDIGNY